MMSENTSVKELADTLRTVAFAAERGKGFV